MSLNMLMPVPAALHESFERWPQRWRPVLRRQLELGSTANAHAAADLLDKYGDVSDVGRLRAFEKTYRRGRKDGLGRSLARRLSPRLQVHDLGRGHVQIGARRTPINQIRRKPAALLMYLVTRPGFTATREQVLEDLWPDGDPDSGANSLNQSLHFLRRELDQWYEVDVSHDYVVFEAELLWLDNQVTDVSSAAFLERAQRIDVAAAHGKDLVDLVEHYSGQFCPEFEYDEWAIAWRSRVHAAYLDLAHRTIRTLVARSDIASAQVVATSVLSVDPSAVDIERKLIWLYAHSGSHSAAAAQYEHLAAAMRSDGLDPPRLSDLTGAPKPQ
jgi:DNA-binding SARP family transcriptional activator